MYIVIGKYNSNICIATINFLQRKNLPYQFLDIKSLTDKTLLSLKPNTHITVPIIFDDKKYIGGYYDLINYLL